LRALSHDQGVVTEEPWKVNEVLWAVRGWSKARYSSRFEEIASGGYEVQAREIVTIPFLVTCQKGYAGDKSMRPDKKVG
jgi:hypothetical protein